MSISCILLVTLMRANRIPRWNAPQITQKVAPAASATLLMTRWTFHRDERTLPFWNSHEKLEAQGGAVSLVETLRQVVHSSTQSAACSSNSPDRHENTQPEMTTTTCKHHDLLRNEKAPNV